MEARGDPLAPRASAFSTADASAVTVNDGATGSFSISCPAGRSVLGGGHELVDGATQLLYLGSAPTTTTWRVMLRNDTGAAVPGVRVRLWIICGAV